jgi:predicted helicase
MAGGDGTSERRFSNSESGTSESGNNERGQIVNEIENIRQNMYKLNEQLEKLNEMLKGVFEGDIGFYVGGMKEKDLKISESKDLILATFEMVSEGLDIQALDTMIMCTPKASIVQTVGRILRKKPEDYENQPLIIDIVDQIPTTIFMSMPRKKVYTSRNYEINFFDVKENSVEKSWVYDYAKEESRKKELSKGSMGFIDSDDEGEKKVKKVDEVKKVEEVKKIAEVKKVEADDAFKLLDNEVKIEPVKRGRKKKII